MPRDPSAPAARRRDIRIDLRLIADMVEAGSRVLDVGCGDGELLDHLWHAKGVDGRGIELSQRGVHACVSRGLSVIQGDADTDLADYPDAAFDYVILSQTLQATRRPREVLDNLMRIGRRAIVSLPNFGYWRVRLSLLWHGRMPMTDCLSHPWHETPNIHLCTVRDFVGLCQDCGVAIEHSLVLRGGGRTEAMAPGWRANWLAEQAIFLLRRDGATG